MLSDSTICITIISILLLLFVILLIEVEAQQELQIDVMCAWFPDGTIDCKEKWIIFIYPQEPDVFKYCYPGVKEFHWFLSGCAVYDDNRGYYMILGSHMNDRSHTGDSVLIHEIKHLQCRCNFHEV